MADFREVAYSTAEGSDYAAHVQTYETFIRLLKVATAAVAITLVLMAIFLT